MRLFVTVILIVFALNSLDPQASSQEKKEGPVAIDLSHSFFPRDVGSEWHYRAFQEKAAQLPDKPGQRTFEKVVITAQKTVDVVRKELGLDGKEVIAVGKDKLPVMIRCTRLMVVSGEKTMFEDVAILEDGFYRFRAADKEIVPALQFFKLPLQAGEKWRVSSVSEGQKIAATFTAEDDVIEVPAGKFKTKYIVSKDFQFEKKMEMETWFAADVGMVKQRVKVGANEPIVLELEKFVPAKK